MDLETLKQELKDEIQRLDQRQAVLKDKMAHLQALDLPGGGLGDQVEEEAQLSESSSKESPTTRKESEEGDLILEALRCLKCGSSLRKLVPLDSSGQPVINSPRLGKSDGGSRYLECPQCLAKNSFVRTTGPMGWRLLVTQLRQ